MATAATSPVAETPRPAVTAISPSRLQELESDIVKYTDSLYNTAVEDNRDYQARVKETVRMIEFLGGKQWSEKQRYARNRPVLPRMQRAFWENVGLLTDLSIDFSVKMFNRSGEFDEFQHMLNQLAIHWAMKNLESPLYNNILYGLLHTGPAKMQWNSALDGGRGDVQMLAIAPWQWAVLGGGTDLEDAECMLYFPVVTLAHLERRYGKDLVARIQPDAEYSGGGALTGKFNRPSRISPEQWSKMGEALRRVLGNRVSAADSSVYPMAMQKEFWLRDGSLNESSRTVTVGPADSDGNPLVNWAYRVEPGEPLYPRGRVITTAGGVLLEDFPNPYWDARFPFPVFRPFRVPWDTWGYMRGREWMGMSVVLNRIMGGILDMIHGVLEPTLIGPKGALPQPDWDAIDTGSFGNKIKYNNNAPKAPEIMKRGEIPGWVFNYLAEIGKEYDMSSGASAMQQALQKKQVPGGDSLEMILSSRSWPVKVESRSLANFIEDAGQMFIARVLQFYSVAKRTAILGVKGGLTSSDWLPIYGSMLNEGMTGEEMVRKFTGVIRRDTLLASEKERKIQLAFQAWKMGKISDKVFFELADVNFPYDRNVEWLLKEGRLKILMAAAAAALTGKGQHKGK